MNFGTQYNRTKWYILSGILFYYLFIYCGRQNFGFAILGIQQTLHLNTVDTGIISAGMLFFYGVGQAINGNLADKYSSRWIITIGALTSVILNFITSFAIGFWSLLIPWCLNGYAQSLAFTAGSKIITNWCYKKERGKIFGLYLSSSGASSIVAFSVSIIVLEYVNWIWLFRLPIILILFSGIVFFLVVRDTPEELGFPAVNKKENINQTHPWQQYKKVFSNFHFQMASLCMGFCTAARYGLLLWVPVIFLGPDWQTNPQHVWITITLPIGMAIGCIVTGTISDTIFEGDRLKPTILFMSLGTIFTTALYFIPPNQSLLAMLLLFLVGFFIYGPQAPLFALCPDLLGSSLTATGVGVMNAYAYAFSAIGEAIIGYSIYLTHQFTIVYIMATLCCLLSVIAALFAGIGLKDYGYVDLKPLPLNANLLELKEEHT